MAEFGSVPKKRKLDQLEDETQFSSNKKIKAEENSHKEGNFSFSDLPHEIVHLILSFITNDTQRRHIRSVCQQWFAQINYNEFKIGVLLTSEIDEFSRCFGRYQKPIGLKFMRLGYLNNLDNRWNSNKTLMKSAPMFQSMLGSLTQLTALDLRLIDFEIPPKLFNLQSLTVISPLHQDTISRLTNLRRLKTDGQFTQLPTTLESLHLYYNEKHNVVIDGTYSRLTDLIMSTTTRCNIPDALTNLRKLAVFELRTSISNWPRMNLIRECPNLEELITTVDRDLLPTQYPSTLTKLHVLSPRLIEINEDLTQLKDLVCSGFRGVKLQNNSRMKSLEDCVIENPNSNVTILEQLDSQKIKNLCIKVVPENSNLFSKFTNLINLKITLDKVPANAILNLVPLTRLTQLILNNGIYPQQWMIQLPNLVDLKLHKLRDDIPELINFETMNHLTSLELRKGEYDSISIINLTNLMRLYIDSENPAKTIEIHGLSTVTNLTLLVCQNYRIKSANPPPPLQNFQELALLTKLRTLNFNRRNNTAFSDITVLTALQHLTILDVRAISQSIWCLTKLTRLQKVYMQVDQPAKVKDGKGILECLPFCYHFESDFID